MLTTESVRRNPTPGDTLTAALGQCGFDRTGVDGESPSARPVAVSSILDAIRVFSRN